MFTQNANVSNIELRKLSEELFDKLPSTLYNQLSINYQGKTDNKNIIDMAPDR